MEPHTTRQTNHIPYLDVEYSRENLTIKNDEHLNDKNMEMGDGAEEKYIFIKFIEILLWIFEMKKTYLNDNRIMR